VSLLSIGQKEKTIGIEFGLMKSGNAVDATNGSLLRPNRKIYSLNVGITYSNQIGKNLFAESGLYYLTYLMGWGFKGFEGMTDFGTNAMTTIQIPFLLRYRIPLFKNKLFINTAIGALYGYNLTYDSQDYGYVTAFYGPDTLRFTATTYTDFKKNYLLFGFKIGFELPIKSKFLIGFTYSDYTGLNYLLIETNVWYNVNNNNFGSGYVLCNGDYSAFNISLKYKLGKPEGDSSLSSE